MKTTRGFGIIPDESVRNLSHSFYYFTKHKDADKWLKSTVNTAFTK